MKRPPYKREYYYESAKAYMDYQDKKIAELKGYAQHKRTCDKSMFGYKQGDCTCGLKQALK